MRQPITSAATEPDDDGVVAPLHAARPAIGAAQEQRQGFAAVLRRRDFRYLWGAQLASQLADKFLMFTLLVFMYTLTRRASLQSVLMIAYTLPSVLLSAPAGVYADRHDKRLLMVGTNVVRGALILLIPLAQLIPVLRGQAWPLIVITLLFSSAGQIFAPAEAASIPTLVNRQQITEATSLFMTTVILTLVLGVPAATIAIGFFGNLAPFYIATGLFGLAALSVWKVSVSLRAEKVNSGPATNILRELRDGIDILRRSPPASTSSRSRSWLSSPSSRSGPCTSWRCSIARTMRPTSSSCRRCSDSSGPPRCSLSARIFPAPKRWSRRSAQRECRS